MTLDHVPLTVRLGGPEVSGDVIHGLDGREITKRVSGVTFRKEAIGGCRSLTVKLSEPLDRVDQVAALTKLHLFDSRTAMSVAEGRITDLGREASSSDGQQWDLVAFGPAQHPSDKEFPYILVDQSQGTWERGAGSTKNADTATDQIDEVTPCLEVRAAEGKNVATTWLGAWRNRVLRESGIKLARVKALFDSGVTNSDYLLQIVTWDGGSGTVAKSVSSNTTAATQTAVVVTDFSAGDMVDLRARRQTAAITGVETHWFQFSAIVLRALLLNASGAEITTGYTTNTVLAHEVVRDLLGRHLDQYDGPAAFIDPFGTFAIDQLAYPDGVTAAQVLDDLMMLEPGYRWNTGPDRNNNGYDFTWAPWPSTVRYEATLEDGGSFPASAQELYNRVTVRWRQSNGAIRSTTRTGVCPALDDKGLVRSTTVDLGDEVASSAQAVAAGDNFLADHKFPKNAGTLNIARPIRDVTITSGRLLRPHEIEAGELIRVRGIESYQDALNAGDNDGQTVFRIWSVSYNSDSDTAVLELDTWSRTTANAIARLATRRPRRR